MMHFEDFPENVRDAIDRIAARSGKAREDVIKAYRKAANGSPVNSDDLFLDSAHAGT